MPIVQLLEPGKDRGGAHGNRGESREGKSVVIFFCSLLKNPNSAASGQSVYYREIIFIERLLCRAWDV